MLQDSPAPSETTIGPEVHLQGNLKGKTNVRIHGTLDGDIIVDGSVVVGEGGRINGDIHARSVIVEGNVYGNIEARDKAHLGSNAKIKGNIRTNSISIQEGAWFEGSVTEQPGMPETSDSTRDRLSDYEKAPVYQ